jgi:2-polyprenyl-3-methyl-5-hydroxy-6-metoxy-1,4-benzoquinol methylase
MSGDPFTGEFLVEGDPRFEADLAQHLAAYQYCAPRVAGERVAEVGCGSGYGAARLAATAREVDAYERNPRALAWARAHYRAANLRYLPEGGDAGLSACHYDAVVCFQVIEHVAGPCPFLDRLHALLRPGGTLYLTTPNRLTSAGENIYHVHEYEPRELTALLARHFERVVVLGITGGPAVRAYQVARRAAMRRFLRWDPLGWRRRVPMSILTRVYPLLARRVRSRARGPGGAPGPITPGDFRVGGGAVEAADDLLAICVRGPR